MSGSGDAEDVGRAGAVRVWDLPTRLFHWTLALLVVGSIVSAHIGSNAMAWHLRFGYVVFTLLAFRILWGLVGGHWSRFASFVYAPATTLRYLRGASRADEHHDVGHNPLGAFSVLGLYWIGDAKSHYEDASRVAPGCRRSLAGSCSALDEANDRGDAKKRNGGIGLVAGAALGGIGGWLLLRKDETTAFRPTLAPGYAGAQVVQRW